MMLGFDLRHPRYEVKPVLGCSVLGLGCDLACLGLKTWHRVRTKSRSHRVKVEIESEVSD
jgi:hypothetical protein